MAEEPTKVPKKRGPKPRVFTKREIKKMETLGEVLSREQIAAYFKMSKAGFYNALNRQPEAMEALDKGRAQAIHDVAKGLLTKARDGNLSAAIFYLKSQAGWRETSDVHNNVSGEMSITIQTGVPRPDAD
jgi:hypothetical protein